MTHYDGIEIELGSGDGKLYTLVLKDEVPRQEEGSEQEKSGVSWEARMKAPLSSSSSSSFSSTSTSNDKSHNSIDKTSTILPGTKIFIPWSDFKPTYRGKEIEDGDGEKRILKKEAVTRIGFMMRSYFGQQEGDFEVEIRAVVVRVKEEGREGYESGGGWGKCVMS